MLEAGELLVARGVQVPMAVVAEAAEVVVVAAPGLLQVAQVAQAVLEGLGVTES